MILIDSSVWINHFRNNETAAVKALRSIAEPNRLRVADLIRLEILFGCRDERHAALIDSQLSQIPEVKLLAGVSIDACARNYRLLREKGLTIRTAIDVIIGSFCIENNYLLLHDDRDFSHMSVHLGLEFYS